MSINQLVSFETQILAETKNYQIKIIHKKNVRNMLGTKKFFFSNMCF